MKIEIHEEKWAGRAEVPRVCQVQRGKRRPEVNGITRDKAQKAQGGRVAIKDFEQERTEKTERKNVAENAVFLDMAPQNSRNFDMGSGQDDAFWAGFSGRHFVVKRNGQNDWHGNGEKATKPPRIGRAISVETIGLLNGYCWPETCRQRGS